MKEFARSDERMAFLAANEMMQEMFTHEHSLGQNSPIWRKIQEAVVGRMDGFILHRIYHEKGFVFQSPNSKSEQLWFFGYSKDPRINIDLRFVSSVDSKTKVYYLYGLDSSTWKDKPGVGLYKALFPSVSDDDLSLTRIIHGGPLDVDYISIEESASIWGDEETAALRLEWKNGDKYRMLRMSVPEALQRFPIPD